MDIPGRILTNVKCHGIFLGLLKRNDKEIVGKAGAATFCIQGSKSKVIHSPEYGDIHGWYLDCLNYGEKLVFTLSFPSNCSVNDETWSLFALPMIGEHHHQEILPLDASDEEYLHKGLTFEVKKSKNLKRKLDQSFV